MARSVSVQLCSFDELSPKAKETARENFRIDGVHYDWWDSVYEDFRAICTILGIDLKTRDVPLMSGKTRQEPCIWFSGFSCQGDGASFEAIYRYRKGAAKELRQYCPRDTTLHDIADQLQDIQRRHFWQLAVDVSLSGHRYVHAYMMGFTIERDDMGNVDRDAEEGITEAMRSLANWLYAQLRVEYAYLTSDEAVDESLGDDDEAAFLPSGETFHHWDAVA